MSNLYSINELELNNAINKNNSSDNGNKYHNSIVKDKAYEGVLSAEMSFKYVLLFFKGIKIKLYECIDLSSKLKGDYEFGGDKEKNRALKEINTTINGIAKAVDNIGKVFKKNVADMENISDFILQIIVHIDKLAALLIAFNAKRDGESLRKIILLIEAFESVLNGESHQ